MQVNFSKIRETWSYFSTEETKFVVNYEGETKTIVEGNSYKTNLIAPVVIKSNESFTINSTQTYTFTTEELNKEQSKIQDMFKNSEKYFEENKTVDAAEASPLYVRDHVALTIEERKAEKSR